MVIMVHKPIQWTKSEAFKEFSAAGLPWCAGTVYDYEEGKKLIERLVASCNEAKSSDFDRLVIFLCAYLDY